MRLNKYLAHSGIASRRAADTLIMQGHVTVNGVIELGGYAVYGPVLDWLRAL